MNTSLLFRGTGSVRRDQAPRSRARTEHGAYAVPLNGTAIQRNEDKVRRLFAAASARLDRRIDRRPRLALALLAVAAFLAIAASPAAAETSRAFETQITEAGGEALDTPFALTTDAANHLWLSDTGTSKVSELEPGAGHTFTLLHQNTGAGSWGASQQIQSLAFGKAAGLIYVADSNLDDIWGLSAADATYSGLDYFGSPETALTRPHAWDKGEHAGCCFLRIAADNSAGPAGGDLYVSSGTPAGGYAGRVTRIKPNGEEAPFTASEPYVSGNQLTGPFSTAVGIATHPIAIGPEGEIYVAGDGSEPAPGGGSTPNGTVFEYEPTGALLREFTEGELIEAGSPARRPLGPTSAIAVDPTTHNLLIAQRPQLQPESILELSPTGALEGQITRADGQLFGGIRALAVDSTGRLYVADATKGAVDVFGSTVKPAVETDGGSVSAVTSTAATLRGEVNPHGYPTTYTFRYGTADCSLAPSACTEVPSPPASAGSGETFLEVSRQLTGLAPATTYHYRLIAENTETGETVEGPDRTFTTQPASDPFALPDARAWELVSPPDKHGALVGRGGESGVVEAAADGGAITYLANAPTEAEPQGASAEAQVLSERDADGWASLDLATPHEAATGTKPTASPEYRLFADDLSEALVQPYGRFDPALSPEASEQTPYLRTLGPCTVGCYRPLVSGKAGYANVPPGTAFAEERLCEENNDLICGPQLLGASADGSHVVLSSAPPLVAGAPRDELYEWSGGRLQLLSVLPPDGAGEELPAPSGEGLGEQPLLGSRFVLGNGTARRAISSDGARVVWEYRGALYLRDVPSGRSLQIDAAAAGCGTCQGGGGRFQVASADGSRVLFTDERRLTPDAGAVGQEPDLYECRVIETGGRPGCALSDLTPLREGEDADVQGDILGAGEDGAEVYLVADGRLGAAGASRGSCADNGETPQAPGAICNLYELSEGRARLVAVLSGADAKDWTRPTENRPARVSPDGRWLAFLSQRPLTGYDSRDAVSGSPDAEAFLFDSATQTLSCASCDPSGARPHGIRYGALTNGESKALPAVREEWEVTGWVSALLPRTTALAQNEPNYQPRYLGDEGRLYFNSVDALTPTDTNGTGDVYQYEPAGVGDCTAAAPSYSPAQAGCIDLISSGTSPLPSGFLDASESGEDVFFLTYSPLSPLDVDASQDVYDAHACTASSPCLSEPPRAAAPCAGEACQPAATAPVEAAPSSNQFSGPGNPRPARSHSCPKGKVKKGGKCVKKPSPSKHHRKSGGKKSSKTKAKKNGS
jgi:hypothetical protein